MNSSTSRNRTGADVERPDHASPETGPSVRSFVRRGGRITPAQRRALERLWPRYGVSTGDLADLDRVFGRAAPRSVEIGFGTGDALCALAAHHPERDFVGIEVHDPGIGRLLARLERQGLDNVRVVRGDAVDVLELNFGEASLHSVLLYFPDPWPKKRHHKRRIVQPEFASVVATRLEMGGVFRAATDWEDYAAHMLAVLDATAGIVNVAGNEGFVPRPSDRPLTRFERRGLGLGHRVWDLAYRRV